jgi:RNA polymerase sigma-70 factor (ECF subfamily)
MHEFADRLAGSLVTREQTLEDEFEALLVETSTLAFRVAYGVLRQREDAEDVAQEAFAQAHRRFHQLRDRARFRAWLVRITWRLAIDRQRAERRRLEREVKSETPVATVPAWEVLDAKERASRLWAAIDALPQKLRQVVILAGIREHDTREVAELLRVPQGTVKSRLFLARQRLRKLLA